MCHLLTKTSSRIAKKTKKRKKEKNAETTSLQTASAFFVHIVIGFAQSVYNIVKEKQRNRQKERKKYMRIFITGDMHGMLDWNKFSEKNWPVQNELTKEDIVLIAGDFSLPYNAHEDTADHLALNCLEQKNFTIVFIDGNHENFSALKQYPIVLFHGAQCHQLRPHIYHMMRGEVLDIADKKILGLGGAVTYTGKKRKKVEKEKIITKHDRHDYHHFVNEIPDDIELAKAYYVLATKKPNIIVTHDGPSDVVKKIYDITKKPVGKYGFNPSKMQIMLQNMLNSIVQENIPVKKWYFGHHHVDLNLSTKSGTEFRVVYNDIIQLPEA